MMIEMEPMLTGTSTTTHHHHHHHANNQRRQSSSSSCGYRLSYPALGAMVSLILVFGAAILTRMDIGPSLSKRNNAGASRNSVIVTHVDDNGDDDDDSKTSLLQSSHGSSSATSSWFRQDHHYPQKQKDDDDDDDGAVSQNDGLGIVWLMSFPNSGTSFTSKLVRHVTELSTASNYGEEAVDADVDMDSEPVYPDTNAGPFWIDPHTVPTFHRPTELVLTKTHCGGRCELCGPSMYIESPHSFLVQCLSGHSSITRSSSSSSSSNSSSGGGGNAVDGRAQKKQVLSTYDVSLVRKAVHLIRDPFDNVVSRFHLEQHGFARDDAKKDYSYDRDGFLEFCAMLEEKYGYEERHSRWKDIEAFRLLRKVPCYSDFVRYVQWHNLAFVTTQDLGVPTLDIHYEKYESNYHETVNDLIDFLEVPQKGEVIEFIMGKHYKDYFTSAERDVIGRAMKRLALQVTWDNIHHYFEEE